MTFEQVVLVDIVVRLYFDASNLRSGVTIYEHVLLVTLFEM